MVQYFQQFSFFCEECQNILQRICAFVQEEYIISVSHLFLSLSVLLLIRLGDKKRNVDSIRLTKCAGKLNVEEKPLDHINKETF